MPRVKRVRSKVVRAARAEVVQAPTVSVTSSIEQPIPVCPICIEDIKDADEKTLLPCKHGFHTACIHYWSERGGRDCPMCRAPLPLGSELAPRPDRRYVVEPLRPYQHPVVPHWSSIMPDWMNRLVDEVRPEAVPRTVNARLIIRRPRNL